MSFESLTDGEPIECLSREFFVIQLVNSLKGRKLIVRSKIDNLRYCIDEKRGLEIKKLENLLELVKIRARCSDPSLISINRWWVFAEDEKKYSLWIQSEDHDTSIQQKEMEIDNFKHAFQITIKLAKSIQILNKIGLSVRTIDINNLRWNNHKKCILIGHPFKIKKYKNKIEEIKQIILNFLIDLFQIFKITNVWINGIINKLPMDTLEYQSIIEILETEFYKIYPNFQKYEQFQIEFRRENDKNWIKKYLILKDNCIYIMGSQESQKAELKFLIPDCTVQLVNKQNNHLFIQNPYLYGIYLFSENKIQTLQIYRILKNQLETNF